MPSPARRVLLTPRWVLLTALLLAVVAACAALGAWQWRRGNVVVAEPAATRPVVDVERVVGGGDPLSGDEVGQRVRVRGAWDPAVQLRVPGRALDGAEGAWAVGLVRLAGGGGVPVVRGWLPEGAAAVPAGGPAALEGVLQAPEAQDVVAGRPPLPAGEAWVVSPALLVNAVDYPVVPAYVVAADPAADPAGAGLRAVPPPEAGSATRRLDWRNIGYALQWGVFAGFAVVVWGRTLRDELRAADPDGPHGTHSTDGPHGPDDPPPDPGEHPTPVQDRSAQLLEERTR